MSAALNPEMLILARESRGLSQTDLHRKTGIPQAAISKYESGVAIVPEDRLKTIAEALGYPTRFFLRPDRVHGYGSSCFYHRKQQSLPVRKLREVQAQMNVRRLAITPLLQGIDIETEVRFDRLDIDEYDSPTEIARLVRRNWRLPLGPVQNLIGSIESAGGIVVRGSFGTRKLDAISQWLPGERPLFFVNGEAPGDRLRWTLAHEIGHIAMHTLHSEDQEREADEFAAEFLMPKREIKPDLRSLTMAKLGPLKQYWKVSMAAVIKRAHDLNQITERQYRRFFMKLNALNYRMNEPNPIPQEEPNLIREIIEVHRTAHSYSAADLSVVASLKVEEFHSVYLDQLDEKPRLRLVE